CRTRPHRTPARTESAAGLARRLDAELAQHAAQVRAVDARTAGRRREVAARRAKELLEVGVVEGAEDFGAGAPVGDVDVDRRTFRSLGHPAALPRRAVT